MTTKKQVQNKSTNSQATNDSSNSKYKYQQGHSHWVAANCPLIFSSNCLFINAQFYCKVYPIKKT